jgi:hypothetical protein
VARGLKRVWSKTDLGKLGLARLQREAADFTTGKGCKDLFASFCWTWNEMCDLTDDAGGFAEVRCLLNKENLPWGLLAAVFAVLESRCVADSRKNMVDVLATSGTARLLQ